jgi:hypothetical protein
VGAKGPTGPSRSPSSRLKPGASCQSSRYACSAAESTPGKDTKDTSAEGSHDPAPGWC